MFFVVNNFSSARLVFSDGKVKEACYDDRTHCTQEKSQKIYPFKKRKFFYQDFSTSNRGSNRDDTFHSSEKRINGKHCTAGAIMHVPFPLFLYIPSSHLGFT